MGDFKPAEMFVGVIELFAVLLPGAFLMAGVLYALPETYLCVLEDRLATNAVQWVAFGFGAYALGALVFPIASLFDRPYDLYRAFKTRRGDHTYQWATALRCEALGAPLGSIASDIPMNTFQWSKSLLMLRAPTAFADVQRYEAESKFFRSMVIALFIVGALAMAKFGLETERPQADLLRGLGTIGGITLVLLGLSAWRYAEQRFKSTQWAYAHVITLQLAPPPAAKPDAGHETAGGK